MVPRYKHSAVDRNRLKRRLRELSRTRLIPADVAADVVLRIRPDAYDATFDALTADVERALSQLQRWRPTVVEQAIPLGEPAAGTTPVALPSDTNPSSST